MGSNYFALIPAQEREWIASNISELTPDVPMHIHEYRFIAHDGKMRWLRAGIRAVFDKGGCVLSYYSYGEDITERKQLEEERDRILDLSPDLICSAGMDGYFKYLNPAWEKILGYTHEELLSKPFLSEEDGPVTTLYGPLRDQAALSGVLNTLYHLHVPVVLVESISKQEE